MAFAAHPPWRRATGPRQRRMQRRHWRAAEQPAQGKQGARRPAGRCEAVWRLLAPARGALSPKLLPSVTCDQLTEGCDRQRRDQTELAAGACCCAVRNGRRSLPCPGAWPQATTEGTGWSAEAAYAGREWVAGVSTTSGTHEVASSPPPGPVDGRWLTLSALGGEVARMVGGVAVDGRPWGIGRGGASSHLHRDSVGG